MSVLRFTIPFLLLIFIYIPSFSNLLKCYIVKGSKEFHLGVFTTLWKRPTLTDFVLAHWHQLKLDLEPEGLILDLFCTGSEGNKSKALAEKHG